MKTLIQIILFSSLICSSLFAQSGRDGGGGDPQAVEFMKIGRQIEIWIKAGQLSLEIDSNLLKIELDRISKTLDDKNPEITFPTNDQTLLCFGVQKIGCVLDSRKIQFARGGWNSQTLDGKYSLVALELFKLLKIKRRYELAGDVGAFAKTQFSVEGPTRPRNVELDKMNDRLQEILPNLCEPTRVERIKGMNLASILTYSQYSSSNMIFIGLRLVAEERLSIKSRGGSPIPSSEQMAKSIEQNLDHLCSIRILRALYEVDFSDLESLTYIVRLIETYSSIQKSNEEFP